MAYPIKLFDFQSEEGRKAGTEFLQHLNKTLTDLFGIIKISENQRQFHIWDVNKVPTYLTDLGTSSVERILKQLPEGEMKWKGTVGIYGRKRGSVIKKENNILYRIVINMGDIEVYHLDGEGFDSEPVALPNGYALLCSPIMIDKIDIKVDKNPFRKNMDPKMKGIVPKIRARQYMRSVIVLDLMIDGLKPIDSKEASVPKEDEPSEEDGPIGCPVGLTGDDGHIGPPDN